jgi:hypothetical protein
MGMLCWEVIEKRKGDTTSLRNAAADFAFSHALEVVSCAHAVPTICTTGAFPRGNDRFKSIQRAWAGGALRTVPATTQPATWHPISRLLYLGGLFEGDARYQSRPIAFQPRAAPLELDVRPSGLNMRARADMASSLVRRNVPWLRSIDRAGTYKKNETSRGRNPYGIVY